MVNIQMSEILFAISASWFYLASNLKIRENVKNSRDKKNFPVFVAFWSNFEFSCKKIKFKLFS